MKGALVLAIGIVCQYPQERPTVEIHASIPQWGQRVVDAIHVKQGDTIIDVGAGKGVWLPVWSAAVGPTGRVIAEDIDKGSLDRARKAAEERKLTNVEFIQGTSHDPVLPERCADLIVVMDAYHEFQYPAEMLAHISRTLKDAGRLAIIDFYRPGKLTPNLPPPWHIRLDKDDAIHEIESEWFRLLSVQDHLGGKQYIAIFANNKSRSTP
ncbi:MAG TPA: methyltransferase domain-containing protein [Bryobacteraceae bacterium]